MIALIKVIHSAVFVAIATSLGLITWAAITGRPSRLTWLALAVVTVEVAAVVLARGDCPLTTYTERLRLVGLGRWTVPSSMARESRVHGWRQRAADLVVRPFA